MPGSNHLIIFLIFKMKRQTNKRRNNNKNRIALRSAPVMQLSKQLNLYGPKSATAMVNITYPGLIYGYSVSGLYTFTNNADVRYLAFSTITAAAEFTNFATSFANYRIRSCSVIINPLYRNVGTSTGTLQLPLLVLGCDPQESNLSTNPTNSAFILRDQNHLFSSQNNVVKSVTFTFPGVGTGTNIWRDTDTQPDRGVFYVGCNATNNWFSGGNVPVFEYYMNLLIEFKGTK